MPSAGCGKGSLTSVRGGVEAEWETIFDVIRLVAVGDEQGVIRLHDDQIIHAQQGDAGTLAGVEDDVVFRVDLGNFAVGGVFIALDGKIFRDGNPGADIVPVEGSLQIEHAFGFFHQGIVDGNGSQCRKLFGHGGHDVLRLAEL